MGKSKSSIFMNIDEFATHYKSRKPLYTRAHVPLLLYIRSGFVADKNAKCKTRILHDNHKTVVCMKISFGSWGVGFCDYHGERISPFHHNPNQKCIFVSLAYNFLSIVSGVRENGTLTFFSKIVI